MILSYFPNNEETSPSKQNECELSNVSSIQKGILNRIKIISRQFS